MTVDDRLEELLRSAMPPVSPAVPTRDLWPAIVDRGRTRRPGWIDAAIAAMTVLALFGFPDGLWLLAYHL